MARPVDPVRREARRLQVIDAALTRFAADGYHATTTAAICREAGIGSGTLFHHFPSKASIMVAILEHGTRETRDFFAAYDDHAEPRAVLLGWVEHSAADLRDPRAAGFVRAVGSVVSEPEIEQALQSEDDVVQEALTRWAARAIDRGDTRTDLPPVQVARWLAAFVDGYATMVAGGADADVEVDVLIELATTFLAPR